jgi:hypothetical protein
MDTKVVKVGELREGDVLAYHRIPCAVGARVVSVVTRGEGCRIELACRDGHPMVDDELGVYSTVTVRMPRPETSIGSVDGVWQKVAIVELRERGSTRGHGKAAWTARATVYQFRAHVYQTPHKKLKQPSAAVVIDRFERTSDEYLCTGHIVDAVKAEVDNLKRLRHSPAHSYMDWGGEVGKPVDTCKDAVEFTLIFV